MSARFLELDALAYDYQAALERQNLKQEDVNRLRERIKSSEYVPQFIMDRQLLIYLNASNGDIDKGYKVMNNFYKEKRTTKEFFSNRDVESQEVQNSLNRQDFISLPTTPDNCYVFFARLSSCDPKHFIYDDCVKTFLLSTELNMYHNGPRSELIVVVDFRGTQFGHIFQIGINSLRKTIRIIEEAIPIRIKAVHVLNSLWIADVLVKIARPFIRSDLLNKFHFHLSDMDYEKFYDEFVPRSCLPSDYGGTLASVEELNKKHRGNLMELHEYFLLEERQTNGEFDVAVEKF